MAEPQEDYEKRRLHFMLTQLRDDIDDLIGVLDTGTLPPDQVRAGAIAQMSAVLRQLQAASERH